MPTQSRCQPRPAWNGRRSPHTDEEITFDQPLAHVAALTAGALNADHHLMPPEIVESAHAVGHAAASAGWHGVSADGRAVLDLYPIHPTVLPVLVQFFARFGQHERSLFSFLLSSEPFGLQTFADRRAMARNWYRLPDFYDYVRAVFGGTAWPGGATAASGCA